MNEQQEVIIWEAPVIAPPEFRLYYDEKGKVITYTCEKLEGNYIVIDKHVFAEARPDVRVVDGKLTNQASSVVITRLAQDVTGDIQCAKEDISIIVDDTYTGPSIKWKLKIYEF